MPRRVPVQLWVLPDADRVRTVLERSGLKPAFDNFDRRSLDLERLVVLDRDPDTPEKAANGSGAEKITNLDGNTRPKSNRDDDMPNVTEKITFEIPMTSTVGVEQARQVGNVRAFQATPSPLEDHDDDDEIDCIAGGDGPDLADSETAEDSQDADGLGAIETFPALPDDDDASEFASEDDIVADDLTFAYQQALSGHFRCLGYEGDLHYFLPLEKGQVISLRASSMKEGNMVELADINAWRSAFGSRNKNGRITISWSDAVAFVLRQSHRAGIWDPTRVAGVGCWNNGSEIVANFGEFLYLDGQGLVAVEKFEDQVSEKVFVKALKRKHPDFTHIMTADDPRVTAFKAIIDGIRWKEGTDAVSKLNFLGWICMAPICGVVPSKPYAWLTGPANSGKTWIVKNIVLRALGDFCINSATSTSVAGLRNHLQGNALPVVFDMVDFSRKHSSSRLSDILELARQSANDVTQEAVHFEAIPGGGSNRSYSLSSTFLFSSQMPDAERASDLQGAARVCLGRAHDRTLFLDTLERPIETLMTPDFSLNFVGRMISRAALMHDTQQIMSDALSDLGMGEGQKKIHAPLAAACWLFLQDGLPSGRFDAQQWLRSTFGDIVGCIANVNVEQVEPWQHAIKTLMGKSVVVHSDMGNRTEALGNLLQLSANIEDNYLGDVSRSAASSVTQRHGMRILDEDEKPIGPRDTKRPVYIALHPSSPVISEILEKTGYGESYGSLLMDAPKARRSKKTIRFNPYGPARAIVIPLDIAAPGTFDDA